MDNSVKKALSEYIGAESEAVTYEVELGAVVKFAKAIGDDNPIFSNPKLARTSRHGGVITPPTFLRSMFHNSSGEKFFFSAGVDGGSEWKYFEPVRIGDKITVIKKFVDFFTKDGSLGEMIFQINEIRYINQFDQIVATQRTTGISYEPKK